MRRVFFCIDLSVLRTEDRDNRLGYLFTSIARLWASAAHTQPDAETSFGYKIYDSGCGDYACNAFIQRVASSLALPPWCQGSEGADLSPQDLPWLASLLDHATADSYIRLQGLTLPRRRSSRASDPPLVAMLRALQLSLGGSYLQKLVNDEDSSENETQGLLVLITESISAMVADPEALAQSISPKLSRALEQVSDTTACLWLTPDQVDSSVVNLSSGLLQRFKLSGTISLSSLGKDGGCDREGLRAIPLPGGGRFDPQEDFINIWSSASISSIEDFKVFVAKFCVTGVENENRNRSLSARGGRRAKTATKPQTNRINNNPNPEGIEVHTTKARGRGTRLAEKAAAVLHRTTSGVTQTVQTGERSSAPAHNPPPEPHVDPCSIEDAITKVKRGAAALATALAKSPTPSKALDPVVAIRLLVSSALAGTSAGEDNPDDSFRSDVCVALMARATLDISTIKDMYRNGSAKQRPSNFAWIVAIEVLLRLTLYSKSSTEIQALPVKLYEEITSLLVVLIATMIPTPLGGRRFFTDIVRPAFETVFPDDIKKLEASVWGEEESEDAFEQDGAVAVLRARQASLEASGESPSVVCSEQIQPNEETRHNSRKRREEESRFANVEAKYPNKSSKLERQPRQPNVTKVGGGIVASKTATSLSLRSGEGSAVNQSASGTTYGTAGTRPGVGLRKNPVAFLHRRYNMASGVREVKVLTSQAKGGRGVQRGGGMLANMKTSRPGRKIGKAVPDTPVRVQAEGETRPEDAIPNTHSPRRARGGEEEKNELGEGARVGHGYGSVLPRCLDFGDTLAVQGDTTKRGEEEKGKDGATWFAASIVPKTHGSANLPVNNKVEEMMQGCDKDSHDSDRDAGGIENVEGQGKEEGKEKGGQREEIIASPLLLQDGAEPQLLKSRSPTPMRATKAPSGAVRSSGGKRSLLAISGKTPGSSGRRKGRLEGMLLGGGKPRSSRQLLPTAPPPSPPTRMEDVCIADVMSPAKPSPYHDVWALPRLWSKEKKSNEEKAKQKDTDDESIGDAPAPCSLGPPLPRPTPDGKLLENGKGGGMTSDDEDAAVLHLAATGGLSPTSMPLFEDEKQEKRPQRKQGRKGAKPVGRPPKRQKQTRKQQPPLKTAPPPAPPPPELPLPGVPAPGDDVCCLLCFGPAQVEVQLRIVRIVSVVEGCEGAEAGWSECTIEGQTAPETAGREVKAITVTVAAKDRKKWGATLKGSGAWSHRRNCNGEDDDGKGKGEVKGKDERASPTDKENRKENVNVNITINRDLLRIGIPASPEQRGPASTKGLETGKPCPSPPPPVVATPSSDSKPRSMVNGIDSVIVSPAAHAAAASLLGSLYLGGSPLPPASILAHLGKTTCASPA